MKVQFKVSVEMVVKYLLVAASPAKGVSAADIIAGTGLSKSTVYRVIKAHPGITSLGNTGKTQLYFFDTEQTLAAVDEVRSAKKNFKRLECSPEVLAKWGRGQHTSTDIAKLLHYYFKATDDESKPRLVSMYNSWGTVVQTEHPTPEQISAARSAIGEFVELSAVLQMVFTSMKRHPDFLSDDEFKNVYPKVS